MEIIKHMFWVNLFAPWQEGILQYGVLWQENMHWIFMDQRTCSEQRCIRKGCGGKVIEKAPIACISLMVQGILHSIKSLMWAVLLLLLLMYIFAVCVLQFAVEEHEMRLKAEGILTHGEYEKLVKHFSSMLGSVYTDMNNKTDTQVNRCCRQYINIQKIQKVN